MFKFGAEGQILLCFGLVLISSFYEKLTILHFFKYQTDIKQALPSKFGISVP